MRLGGRLLRWKPIVHCQSDVVMIQHGANTASECSFTRHTHSTRGTSLLRSTPILRYRNVVENTLADTPSGYIQDPANHPRQMVTYNKLSAEAEKTLDEMDRLRSLFSKEELLYVGYTTEAIQRLKQVVVNSKCSTEELREAVLGLKDELDKLVALVGEEVVVPGPLAELHEAAPGRHPKSKNPAIDDDEGLPDTPREHRLFVTVKDVNHVRYVLSLGLRRLNELDEAEALNLDILRTDRENVDALECLLEIFCGSERYHRVLDLLDIDNKATSESLTDGNVELTAPAPNCDSAQPLGPIASLVFSLLSDMMLEVAAQRFNSSGEGATSRYFLAALQPFSRVLSPIQLSHLLVTVVESMDQYLDTVCNHPAVTANAAKDVLGIAIALYRTILARNLHEMVFPEPIHFKMVVMHKQYVALRRADRREESYTAAESALNLYRSHAPSKTKDASDPLPSTATSGDESLEDCEGMYRQIYLQYVADRACDRSGGSHRRGSTSSPPTTPRSATRDDGHATRAAMTLCLGALEEYPSEPQPWVTLAVLLHRADAKGNLPQAISAARQALHCDPLHLTAIATLANFYKADGREALHATMMDRYHLLSFFIDEGASTEDLMATAEEIRDLEGRFGNGDASLGGTPKEAPLDDEAQKMMEATNHQLRKLVLRSPVIGEEVDQRPMPIFFPSQDPDINVERPPPLNDETCPPPPALG